MRVFKAMDSNLGDPNSLIDAVKQGICPNYSSAPETFHLTGRRVRNLKWGRIDVYKRRLFL